MLNSDNIDFIIKDLHQRGLLLDDLKDEIIDHVCSAVEEKTNKGIRFIEAYSEVINSFGSTVGLQQTQKETAMLQNYFTIAIRNLKKHRFYTLINVTGLAIGVASCLVIMLYVINEFSYDKHFANYDRIYRINEEIKFGGNHFKLAVAPAPTSEAIQKDFPEVEASTRFWNPGAIIFRRDQDSFKELHTVFVDSSLFKVFDLPFIEGDPATALKEPNSVVISERVADKYFLNTQPLGQVLVDNGGTPWKITGIIKNIPSNTHFQFDFLLSLVTIAYNHDNNWLSNNFNTYIKLREGADAKALEGKLRKFIDTYVGPQAKIALGGDFTMDKFRTSGNIYEFTLMPVTDIHLNSDLVGELGVNSDVSYVYLFGAIAGFILLIACINFMNLSTARSANRAKEVGIRKVMGSFRSHLVRQFLTESVLLSLISFVVAIIIAWSAMPVFNSLALKELSLPFASPLFWLLLVAAAVFTGVLAGLYPSFFLSAFRPVSVLKGNVAMGTKSGFIRGALVVFQFWISIVLVVGTIAVNRQLSYIQTKKIGFNKDQVIIVHDAYALNEQIQSFKDEVLQDNRIISSSVSGFLPVEGTNRANNSWWPAGKSPSQENMVALQIWDVDTDYVKTLGMKIREGRDFSKEILSDSTSVIINQSAVKALGLEDPIGKKIATFADAELKTYRYSTIVGVVEDFHYESLRQNIGPLALFNTGNTGRVTFRFEAKNTKDIIGLIEAEWKKFAPGIPFDYSFLDEDFGKMYSTEQRLGEIFSVFAVLAIIIACLGLFALTAFTAEQRTKEIGIRKVLGASVSGIVVLLSKEFGKLILIAFVLAAPAAWYGIDQWLENYTYRTEIGVFVYVVAGLSAFAVAWLTMSYQSIKAATMNPVKSLRSE